MHAGDLILGIGLGVLLELLTYLGLTRLFRLSGKAAAMAIGLLVVLGYVPWAAIHWPGADIFAVHLAIYLTFAYALGMIGSRVGKGWHWAPALIVAFFVGVITLNIIFVTVAEKGITGIFAELLPSPRTARVADSEFPGVVSHDFQEKEALYNQYLEQVKAQRERGWQVRKGWSHKPRVGEPADLIVVVKDREGRPISGAEVHGRFLRTSNSRDDFDFRLSEIGGGEYRGTFRMPLPGLWRLVLEVRKGEARHEIRAMTSVSPSG
ncbi:MAG: nitrogen fixation protein FixH [Gammaproteobacteria bacterium]|nr:MAG: nitrogen fixation protein FixH [Gammaproteobacteria bacterium]